MKIKNRRIDSISTYILLGILTAFLISYQIFKINKLNIYEALQISANRDVVSAPINTIKYEESRVYTTSDIDIIARYGIIYDASNNSIIWQKGEQGTLYPLASITKVMTAYTAMHDCDASSIKINKLFADEGLDLGLADGDNWDKLEAIKYMLTISSNDMANMIADTCGGTNRFVAQMNHNSKAMGLGIQFYNPSGLDIVSSDTQEGEVTQTPGAIGTASDIAKMLAIASEEYPEIYDATTYTHNNFESNERRVSGVANTNESIAIIRGATLSKTGTTDLAGGNLGVVYNEGLNRKIVILVLSSTKSGRFSDVQNLYKFVNSL